MDKVTKALVLASVGLTAFFGYYTARKNADRVEQSQPCPAYNEDRQGWCRPVYHDFRDGVSYRVERQRDPPKTHIHIEGDIHARDSDGYSSPTTYIVSRGRNDLALNEAIGLSSSDASYICHTEHMPMPRGAVALPKPDGSGMQPYLSAVDVDCDNTAESLRFWFRYQEDGRTSYRPYPIPRIVADPLVLPLFEAVDRQLRELHERFHVSEIEAIVAREHQSI